MATAPPVFKTNTAKLDRKVPINRGFLGAVREARQNGNLHFCFPVTVLEGVTPQWETLPLKTLRELRVPLRALGQVLHTLQTVDMLGGMWLSPYGWHQIAKSALSPGQFVVWRTEYEDRAGK